MYAIIETGGRQFWVVPGETIQVEKLEAEKGQELTFDALWAVAEGKDGAEPVASRKAKVVAEVIGARKGPKLIVFKRRQKKAYKKMQGHRQNLTDLRIKTISFN